MTIAFGKMRFRGGKCLTEVAPNSPLLSTIRSRLPLVKTFSCLQLGAKKTATKAVFSILA